MDNHGKGGGAKGSNKEKGDKPLTSKKCKKECSKERKPKDACLLYDGPPWARDYPKWKTLNAML